METNLYRDLYQSYYNFIAEKRDPKNLSEVREIHFLTVMVLSTGLLMWAYAILACLTIKSPIPCVVGISASLIHSFSPLLYRTKLSTYTISNIAIGAGCCHQTAFSYFTRGYESHTLNWLAILPLLAGIVAGFRGAFTWGVITILITSLFLYGHVQGYPFPSDITPLGDHISNSLILYGFILLNTFMILLYVNMRSTSEDTLQEQSDKIDGLFRILFHDLANSLGRLSFGMTLLKRNDSQEKNQKGLNMASEATDTMLEITQNVKSMYAVSKGKTAIEFCPTSIIESTEYVQRIFAAEIQKKNLLVITNIIGTDDLSIYVDPVCFKNQILANILSNAIKFSHPGGTIVINAQRLGHFIELRIIDRGIGIPPLILSNLFDIHSKTSRQGTAGENGTGFGMVIMKSFMDLFGATVEVSSTENIGTTFTLCFKMGPEDLVP
jgi:signal transduction histidine kinase